MIGIDANSLKWAYKKLKNYVYYSSPASYLKDKIIQFEENYDENTFENMAQELLTLFSKTHNMVSRQDISYAIFPKKDGVTSVNDSVVVDNFNVFIDMPLKFYLVDILFTLKIFENMDSKASDYSFGNDFDKRLWQIKAGDLAGNILENNLLFANFSTQYDLWKDKIYTALKETDNQDKIILKMDFKRSYYNVYFNINDFIKKHLKADEKCNPIYEFEKHLYRYYSAILDKIIPKEIPTKKYFVHLPIGLFSSACIFNILLKDFDEALLNNSIAYSRYVDDILIVLQQETKSDLHSILNKFFPDLFILNEKTKEFAVNAILDKKGKYIINENKIAVVPYKSGYPLANVKAKLNKIIKPSLDIIEEMDFEDDYPDEYFLFKHDYLKRLIYKVDSFEDEKYDFIKNISDSELINIFDCWKELLSKPNNYDFGSRIKKAIKRTHLNLKSEQLNCDATLQKMLLSELEYASNPMKYEQHLLCNIKQARTLEHIEKIDKGLDDFFYPLIITFDEITLYLSQKQDYIEETFIPEAEELYQKANNLPITKTCCVSKDGDSLYHFTNCDSVEESSSKVRIAVANINLLYDDLKDSDISGTFPSTYSLSEFKHLIDLAKNADAEIILFPEFSLPEQYAFDIVKHCRQRNISIITGLTHRNINGNLVNHILIRDKDLNISLFKWKNYLPLEEKKLCLENQLGYCVPRHPYYVIINNGRYQYSTMTCFEATSIKDRALLCDKLEVLFVPVFNRDTFYFSNIISSFVRDASCFVAQANSNSYGDSRISGPYKQVFVDVVKLKGGVNNYFVVGEIDLEDIRCKNKKGENLENLLDYTSDSDLPNWNSTMTQYLKEYKELKAKPMSAGHERYTNRRNNGLDKN